MPRPSPPCGACDDRRVNCHNPETCAAWGEYLEKQSAWRAAERAAIDERVGMMEYEREKARYLKNCRRKEQKDAE